MLGTLATAAAIAGGAAVAVGGAIVILPVIGFTATGVLAGTTAAAVHSTIGNVAAGSLFAASQSAGVVGMAASTKVAIATVGGAITAAVSWLF